MKPVLVLWLVRHGWPESLAPDYAMMVGLATLLGSVLVLRQAERDGARVHVQARAIVCAYFGALVGGYLFEWIRAVPDAIHAHSFAPIAFAGRAAYGGLIFGALAPAVYLRRRGDTFLDFLDRATLGMGIVFACVRFGCFLEGCDYGRPTASVLGVRFPAGSIAAEAHALAGWVPAGAPSLPVHATELYESAVGLLATCAALVPLRRGRRDGAAFATWLVVYAIGRFLIELLRGDVERGRYAMLSTAQWVSVAILAGIFFVTLARRRRLVVAAAAAAATMTALVVAPSTANAQEPKPAPLKPATAEEALPTTQAPAPVPASATGEPAAATATGEVHGAVDPAHVLVDEAGAVTLTVTPAPGPTATPD
ncbi:MAG: prolipoprotein diacylglyceryl transferase, partial [Labilithrix sp.]|nr:prolipoprotein diacylglyceryl transferase [Labilithrix sp.]